MVTRSIGAHMINGSLWVKMEDCIKAIQYAREEEKYLCYAYLLKLDAETESHTHYLYAAQRLKEARGLHDDKSTT